MDLNLIEQENWMRMLRGEQPLEVPASGDPLTDATLLYFQNPQLALSMAAQAGIPQEQLLQNVKTTNAQNQADRRSGQPWLLDILNETTEDFTENPLLFTAKLGGALTGASLLGGGAAAAGGGGTAGGAATTYPLASGGPITATPLAGGGAAATGSAATAWSPAMMGGTSVPASSAVGGYAGGGGAGTYVSGAAGAAGPLSKVPSWVAPVVGGLVGASGSSDPQTSTSTNEPPAYIRPYLQQAVGAASNLYAAGGTPIPPWSSQTQQAADRIQQRATAGSPVTSAAQNYATQTLNGGFMGSNPWLDRTFNQAAGAVTNQVQSNFGTAGRNPRGADAAGFAADQYNNLATQIYGGDYQAERARQQQMVPYAGQLANQDYVDLDALTNVGGMYDDRARELAAQPGTNLDQYLGRLGMYPGGTQTTTVPTDRNRLAGALGGAMLAQNMFGGQYGYRGVV